MRCPPSPPRQAQGRIGRRSSNDVDGEFASRSVSHPPNSIHFLKLMGTSLPIASPVMPVVGADGGTMRLMPPDLGHGLRTRIGALVASPPPMVAFPQQLGRTARRACIGAKVPLQHWSPASPAGPSFAAPNREF